MDPYLSNFIASSETWIGANLSPVVIFVFVLIAISVGWGLVHHAGHSLKPGQHQ